MGIQIKEINADLLLYKVQLEKKTPFSDRMIERAHRAVEKAEDLPTSKNAVINSLLKTAEVAYSVKTFGYAVTAMVASEIEKKNRKKKLAEMLGYNEEQVAMDENDLETLAIQGKRAKCFGDNIRYNAQISKDLLENIDTIFGNADLQALDDFTCLSSLKCVYGNLNFAQCEDSKVNLSGLQVQMVYGDIHAEKAISTEGLEDLLSVGGTIYYQDKAYTLDQFQQLFGQDTKERQR